MLRFTFFALATAALLALTSPSFAQAPLAYEGFGNGQMADLSGFNGGFGWSAPWAADGSTLVTNVGGNGLTYPGLVSMPGGAITPPGDIGRRTFYDRTITRYTPIDNRVYISFLYSPIRGHGTYGGISFGPYDQRVLVGAPARSYTYGMELGNGLMALTDIPATMEQTALLVVEMTQLRNARQYRLFVNPTVGAPQPLRPSAEQTVTFGTATPGWLDLTNDGGAITDEIRVGLTWASVLPRQGDVNLDGSINVNDLLEVITHWGPCQVPPGQCSADIAPLGGDGNVDVNDLLMVILNWG